jgi:hypothetical protein
LIIGAEAAAEIEHASPWGKAPGEKVPGQRKKIGSAAARAFRERKPVPAPAMETAPVALPVFREVAPTRGSLSWFERIAGGVLVLLMWRKRARS